MMKKVLYGVALTLLAGTSVATLQSCKDDVSDLKTQTSFDLEQLRSDLQRKLSELDSKINKNTAALQGQINQNTTDINKLFALLDQYAKVSWVESMLKGLQDNIYANINNIGTQITHLNGEIVRLNGEISTLQGNVDWLTQQDAALLAKITGALQSINDLDKKYGNLYDDLNTKYTNLKSDYDSLKSLIDGKVDNQEFEELKGRVESNEASIEAMQKILDKLPEQFDAMDSKINGLDEKFTGEINGINSKLEVYDGKFEALDVTIDGIKVDITDIKGDISDIKGDISDIKGDISDIQGDISDIQGDISDIKGDISNIKNDITDIKNDVTTVKSDVVILQGALNDMTSALNGLTIRIGVIENDLLKTKENVESLKKEVYFLRQDLDQLRSEFDALSSSVDSRFAEVNNKMNAFELSLASISSRIDDIVTGLLIQAADSPVFGNFSLPLGVKSTLLFNWYGDNKTGISKFPSFDDSYEYIAEGGEVLERFPGVAEQVSVMDGVIGDVNLGRVYLTINPAGHFFDKNNFALETSKGTKLPVVLDVEKSNDELTFGYSRDKEQILGNGFYSADVKITGDEYERSKGVQAARIEIDENLKSSVKDILKDRTKRNAIDLLKAVYGQLNGKLPAYAVSYNWTNGGQDYAVRSQYDLAVATARPLSYNFSFTTSKRLKKYGHINNILENLKGKFKIEFTPISFDNIEIKLPAIPLDNVNVQPGQTTVSTILDPICIIVDNEPHYSDPIPVEIDIEDVVGSITSQFNDAINDMTSTIKNWTGTANQQISDDLKRQLQPIANQINGMVEDLQGQIDSMIDDVVNKAEPWFQRLNRVVDLYNRVADKINNFLEDPNHYLQVAMFYNQANSNMGILSNVKNDPTPFKLASGNFCLYASSYTGEIVAPAFKKFVAVTNVYNESDLSKPENDGALRTAVNESAKLFNQVVDGNTIRFAVPSNSLKKGYIYEITYQGLDYSGVTSTQKFYIKVI